MSHNSGLVTRPHSFRKTRPGRAGKVALSAFAVLLPRLALAQLAPNSNYDGHDLTFGNYTGQDATNSSFIGTNLDRSSMDNVILNYANLTDARLNDVTLTNAHLINANLTHAGIGGTDARFADLTNANLTSADLTGANLSRANLSNADLTGANLTGATLSANNISCAQVESAGLLNLIDLSYTGLAGCNLQYKQLNNTNFSHATLDGANLARTNFQAARLDSGSLVGANMQRSFLVYASFASANLAYADLSNSSLGYTDFSFASLYHANLSNTDLRLVNLTLADLTGANLTGAKLAPSMSKLPVINGAVVTVAKDSTVTVESTPEIDQGGTLVVNGTLKFAQLHNSGSLQLGDNGILVSSNRFDGVFMHSGSSLSGTGAVNAFVEMSKGTIAPGNSAPGVLTITLPLSMQDSTFAVSIASLTSYSSLNASSVQLFGNSAISIDLQDGYLPFYGDTFEILHSGFFSNYGTLMIPENWEFLQNGGTGTLRYIGPNFGSVAVPESGTFFLIGAAGLPLLYFLRSRRQTV